MSSSAGSRPLLLTGGLARSTCWPWPSPAASPPASARPFHRRRRSPKRASMRWGDDPSGQVAVEIAAETRRIGVGVAGHDRDDLVAMRVEDAAGFHEGLGTRHSHLPEELPAGLITLGLGIAEDQVSQSRRPLVVIAGLGRGESLRRGQQALG